jgi:hypothetical protein
MAKTNDQMFNSNPETVYEVCRKAISDIRFSIINNSKENLYISFNTGRSMASWHGQDLSVSLFTGAGGRKAIFRGSIAKDGSGFTGGGSQVFSWGEKDKLSLKFWEQSQKFYLL